MYDINKLGHRGQQSFFASVTEGNFLDLWASENLSIENTSALTIWRFLTMGPSLEMITSYILKFVSHKR